MPYYMGLCCGCFFFKFSLSLSHCWCHFEYSWTFIFILCSIHLQTHRDLFLFSIHRCYMSISQEFIAPLWVRVRVRKVAELIKCFFMVRYSAMFLFSFYFWFATSRFTTCCFLLFEFVSLFLAFALHLFYWRSHFRAFISYCYLVI